MVETFTRLQAITAADIGADTYDNWMRFGYLRPLVPDAEEKSGWRRFTFFEVVRIAVMARMVKDGLPVRLAWQAGQAVEVSFSGDQIDIASMNNEKIPESYLLCRGWTTSVKYGPKNISVGPWDDGVYVLPLLPVLSRVVDILKRGRDSIQWIEKDAVEKDR
jgi:hypothetical protein